MKMINSSQRELPVRKELMAGHTGNATHMLAPYDLAKPGENVIDVKDGYAHPRRAANGARVSSQAEQCSPGLIPLDKEVRASWSGAPLQNWTQAPATPDASHFINAGMSPGQAQLAAEQAAAVAQHSASPGSALAKLTQQVANLAASVEGLQAENAALRAKAATSAPPSRTSAPAASSGKSAKK